MENYTAVVQKIKYRITVWSSNSASVGSPGRPKCRGSRRCLHTDVHGSVIHSNQKTGAIQVSVDGRTNKTRYIHATRYHPALKREFLHLPRHRSTLMYMLRKEAGHGTNTMWFYLQEIPRHNQRQKVQGWGMGVSV